MCIIIGYYDFIPFIKRLICSKLINDSHPYTIARNEVNIKPITVRDAVDFACVFARYISI